MDIDMDMDSQQWGTQQQQESDHQQLQHQAKVPKLQLITDIEKETHVSALPLFAAAPLISTGTTAHSSLTPFPLDSTTQTRFSWGGGIVGLFSLAQWQELELQALIYKYMLAGAPVPSELILPIKKSLLAAQPYYYQHHQLHYQHLPTAMLQGGYWGRCAMDPEPGRCRRTDGKKWRCSREVVPGHKYCERHVHRGRNRSRKHVELATTTPTPSLKPTPSTPPTSCKDTNHFTLNHSTRGIDGDHKESTKSFCSNYSDQKVDSHVLRKFFSERPRSQAQHESNMITTAGTQTLLSISINPGNPPSSDVSLKLSTGGSLGSSKDNIGDGGGVLHPKEPPSNAANHAGNWSAGWGNGNHGEDGATGGPLAEALRSSTTSTASPTSVLQKTSRISASETSSISI